MIKVENLSKVFVRTDVCKDQTGNRKKAVTKQEEFYAVDHISFEVAKGEIVGILGPNGAGKTTLLRMLGNLMEPTEGRVIIGKEDGSILTDMVEMKKEIGYLSENTKLYHRFSTREMLYMLGEIYGMGKEECKKRAQEIFDVLDMNSFGDNRIEKLSTGQMKRASIARCLIHDPQIYIFDEPTLGLDIMSADAIVEFMKGQKQLGKTVLYSTHYLEEAQYLCDRILMIMNGKIVKQGAPDELLMQYGAKDLREVFHAVIRENTERGEEEA
ncbi:MAG: ABC transporter ATP-binding protein [Lachnospiraceae bacterium]|jgi:sodium transport system ATP-binding protein|nr:ABC transporter ATP-binding protein [Lachnospiraceae bacterium]